MRKTSKILLGFFIAMSMNIFTGCSDSNMKESNEYENMDDFEKNVKNKRSTTVDGKEVTEYEMNNGMVIQAPED